MISDHIFDNIPPQMKILNMVIPILIHFCIKLERCKPQKAACHPTIWDVINDFKLFHTVKDILLQIFDVILMLSN